MSYQNQDNITIHDASEFDGMRAAGSLASSVLDALTEFVEPGITTNAINDFAHNMIIEAGAIPAPLNYKGFPKSVCTSVNHVICHGIPDDKILKNGDIVNIDVTVIVDGWHGDTSRMYFVGDKVPIKAKRLVEVTYDATMLAISMVKPGLYLGDIGHAIESHVTKFGYSSVRDFCGHGLGKVFHAPPNVLHYGKAGTGIQLEEGMFFTIEPMINIGKNGTKLSKHDGWTVTTKDRSLSAQFEHSIGVTKDGVEIFTKSKKGLHSPPYNL